MSIKLCKDCKHMERGFLAWFKDGTQKRCTRQDVEYTDKVSGIKVKRTILLNCQDDRLFSINKMASIGSGERFPFCPNSCGKEGQFFEARDKSERRKSSRRV